MHSLLGKWTGCEQKHIYKSSPEGMESVTRKFTFTVEFLADCALRGVLKHEDNDGEGRSKSITGSWQNFRMLVIQSSLWTKLIS